MFTDEQQAAINWNTGPMLLNAGAGAGKTSCLVERYKRLVANGVLPQQILAITFTNKAANEMKERITKAMNSINKADLHIFTFHGLCNYWLRRQGHTIGKTNYTIMDESEAQSILWSMARRHSMYGHADTAMLERENKLKKQEKLNVLQSVLNKIDTCYNLAVVDACTMAKVERKYQQFCINALTDYKVELDRQNVVTFSSLHDTGISLFKATPSIARRYTYFMVDEFQDSNPANLELIKTMVYNGNIVAVGD